MHFETKERPMSNILSYCGLVCTTCPVYVATREVNKEEQTRKRIEIAKLCKEQYGMMYELSDITDCDGCCTESERIFSGCHNCAIRTCAKQKVVESCAYCSDYICQRLESFFVHDSAAKIRLDEMRHKMFYYR
jgi:hypothetical protein